MLAEWTPSADFFDTAPVPCRVPKLCGADMELGNFIVGVDQDRTGPLASQLLLSRIPGLPVRRAVPAGCDCEVCRQRREFAREQVRPAGNQAAGSDSYNPQDVGRKFLPANGGAAYIDLDHLELCLPEVRSAFDHVAASHAMLQIARQAMGDVNRQLAPGKKLQVLVNNSDGHGNSYGSHLNVLIARRAWDNLFHFKMHHLLYLASFQVASIVVAGQGKVGAENGAPAVDYQISQRADFFETLTGLQTTYRRPIVNSRDEALTGTPSGRFLSSTHPSRQYARLHVIFYDNNLCHVAALLKIGLLQIAAAMIETEQVNTARLLDDPVAAVVRYSHDPTLRAKARLTTGKQLTAVDLMRHFLDDMRAFIERGGCDAVVPHAEQILPLADKVLRMLAERDFDGLAGQLDWVLKHQILTRAMQRYSQFDWQSPQIKHLDHLYSSLDPEEGLFWAYLDKGPVQRVVSDEQIDRFTHAPPDDTRAYTRAMLLRRAMPSRVQHVDWDRIEFRSLGNAWSPSPGSASGTDVATSLNPSDPLGFNVGGSASGTDAATSLDLSDPLGFTKADTGHLFHPDHTLTEIFHQLSSQKGDASCFPANPSATN